MNVSWPDGLSTQDFLDNYWQKKPLLMRQALPNFETPVTPNELAGMSLEEGTTPRIITQDSQGHYQLEHGPFAADRYESIGNKDWSLLITDCEKHWPELGDWIAPFAFLPRWRMDDLMISFAPDGASVGAHIDEYDVFLLQASGTRRWQIDASDNPDITVLKDSDLRILANFNATDTWELEAGDVLYLPPGVPHHGLAVGDDCTTWSIGFRAPSNLDVLDVFSEMLLDTTPLERFTDPALLASSGAEIKPDALEKLRHMWESATKLSDEEFKRLVGVLLTRGGIAAEDAASDDSTGIDNLTAIAASGSLNLHSFTQVAYVRTGISAELFVNRDAYVCSAALARAICDRSGPIEFPTNLSATDLHVIQQLYASGALLNNDELS